MRMNNKISLQDRTSERDHQAAVENLARAMNRSREVVNTLYAMVLRHYARTARIKYFLSPLVVKRVKELLREDTAPSDIEGRRRHSQEI